MASENRSFNRGDLVAIAIALLGSQTLANFLDGFKLKDYLSGASGGAVVATSAAYGEPPGEQDCSNKDHWGRMVVHSSGNGSGLYICPQPVGGGATKWTYVSAK